MLSLSTLIGLPLDLISKYVNILSKPTEPKVSSELGSYWIMRLRSSDFLKTAFITDYKAVTFLWGGVGGGVGGRGGRQTLTRRRHI